MTNNEGHKIISTLQYKANNRPSAKSLIGWFLAANFVASGSVALFIYNASHPMIGSSVAVNYTHLLVGYIALVVFGMGVGLVQYMSDLSFYNECQKKGFYQAVVELVNE